jgi:hypothetical protein
MVKNTSPEVLAYFAGLVDGEGNVGVYRTKHGKSITYSPKIVITSTSIEIVSWLLRNVGGTWWTRKRRGCGWKECYSWQLQAESLVAVCALMLPYMVIKRKQVELLLEYPYGCFGQKGMDPKIRRKKADLYERTLELNKVGDSEDVGNNG